MKTLVIIESPFAAATEKDRNANIAYARKCVADSLARNEAPICSHLLFPQLLDDNDPTERALGIEAGLAWYRVADKCVVYADRGYSGGMAQGQLRASVHGVPIEVRYIGSGECIAVAHQSKSTSLCAECGEPQFDTPSGITCCNGHGGADSIEREEVAA